jgi:hypothetical protein
MQFGMPGGFSMLISSTGADGTQHQTRHSFGAQRGIGSDWPAEPVARAAAAALAAALAEAGAAPLEGCVEELEDSASGGKYSVAARRVHASPGFAHPAGSAAASLHRLTALDDGSAKLVVVQLTHVFALPGDVPQRLRLHTLILPNGRPAPQLLATVFGAGAHVALSAPEDRVFTDVSLGDAGSLSADALAALPAAERDALRSALRVQRLAATAACLEARWPAGFCALQLGVTAMKPALGPALSALASRLAELQSGGAHTRASLIALTQQAEALEATGRFMEASALYKECLQADARNPGARLLPTPPQTWSYYGLALKRAGRFSEAHAAYELGLRALEAGPVEPETPEWRTTNRLSLLGFIVTLGQTTGDMAMCGQACQRIFAAYGPLFDASGEDAVLGVSGGTATMTGTTSGRRFEVVHRWETEGPNSGLQLCRVEELPSVNPRSLPPIGMPQHPAQQTEAEARSNARKTLQAREAAAMPKLPQARCALCGEAASKRCSACGVPAYCGPDCQKQHWKSHKPACKAAQAAAAVKAAA